MRLKQDLEKLMYIRLMYISFFHGKLLKKGGLSMTTIIGVRLDNRTNTAVEFQKTLTHFGCAIKTRLGLHEVADNKCAPNGLILLEVIDDNEAVNLETELIKIEGLELQKMKF